MELRRPRTDSAGPKPATRVRTAPKHRKLHRAPAPRGPDTHAPRHPDASAPWPLAGRLRPAGCLSTVPPGTSATRRRRLLHAGSHHLGKVLHLVTRTAYQRLLAERTGGDNHLGARRLQLARDRACNLQLLAVRDGQIGHRGAAAKGIFARLGRFEQLAHRLDDGTRLVVDAAAAPQFAGVVVGIARGTVLDLQASGAHQAEDILRMVQHLDAVERIILAEDLQTNRARGDQRRNAVLAEELRIVLHHLARRVGLARQLERTATADASLAVGPPHLLARSAEELLHGRERTGREQRHAAGEVAHLALALRAVKPLEVAVAPLVGHVAHLVARVEPQRIEVNVHGALLDAAAAHEAVVGRGQPQRVVAAVTQEVDRLHVVDAQHALQLAGVDADAAARAGLDLEVVVGGLLLGRAEAVAAQEDERNLGKDVHVAREGERHEEDTEARGVEPPGHRFERHEREHLDMGGQPAAQTAREEATAAVDGAGDALGHQSGREDEPQRREGHAVTQNMVRRAAHAHGLRVEALAPGQRHAREDEEQQQVHHEVEEGLVLEPRGEVLEKDVALQRHPAQPEVRECLKPPDRNEEEPPEGERHVHVAQQGVHPEDAPVEQRLAHHLAQSFQRPACGDSLQNEHLVGTRQSVEPRTPLPEQHGEHQRRAHDEGDAEWCVECHIQKLSMPPPRRGAAP